MTLNIFNLFMYILCCCIGSFCGCYVGMFILGPLIAGRWEDLPWNRNKEN